MKPCIGNIKKSLTSHLPECPYQDAHSLLELLYAAYTEANPVVSTTLTAHYETIQCHIQHLPTREQDAIYTTICSITAAQEKTAFLEGIRLGFRLSQELTGER